MKIKLRAQGGFALITALLLLIGLMLLGLSAINMSVLDEKLAGNVAHRNTTFHLAEAALRQGEEDYAQLPTVATDVARPSWYVNLSQKGASASGWSEPTDWSTAKTLNIPGAQSSQTVQYIIENLSDIVSIGKDKYQYVRITARAQDSTNRSSVVLQSILARARDDAP